jgi:TonB-linked SusC/RagA family outer membrane protein
MKKWLQRVAYPCLCHKADLFMGAAIFLLLCMQASANDSSPRTSTKKHFIADVQKDIRGRITNNTGQPLEGVTVAVQNSTVQTITNANGEFSLSVPDNAVLVFSYVGYASQTVSVGNRTEINLSLVQSDQTLSDVVVVGYGTQKRRDVSGSVVSVKVNDIKTIPVSSFEAALSGRASGVQVIQGSAPGEAATVRIRGISSTGNNDPLWIIDGIPASPGTSLNPGDIETMDVLKDASATAIYGSRAANGVIIVTTKRGKAGKVKLDFDTYYGYRNLWRKLDVLNAQEFATLANRAFINNNLPPNPAWANPAALKTTDWQDEVTQNGPLQNYNLTLSGGSDKLRTALTLNYYKEEGSIILSKFDRYSVRINADYDVSRRLKFGTSLQFSNTSTRGVPTNEVNNGVLNQAVFMWPDQPVYNPDGSYNILLTTANPTYYPRQFANPVARLNLGENKSKGQRILGSVFGELEIIKGLKFRSTVGGDIGSGNSKAFRLFYQTTPPNILNTPYNSLAWSASEGNTYTAINTLTYSNIFGRHSVSALAGMEAIEGEGSSLSQTGQNTPSNDVRILSAAPPPPTPLSPNGTAFETALLSYFGRINYAYDDKYHLQLNLRADGSPKFSPDNRWGYFPSVSAMWRISKEDFMEPVSFISDLRLRGSYGETGNQNGIGGFPFLSLYSPAPSGVVFGTNQAISPVLRLSNLGNPALIWESQKMASVAIEAGLFKNALNFTAEYYHKVTDGLLTAVPVPVLLDAPGDFNGSYVTQNAGQTTNKGFEFSVGYNHASGPVQYNLSANLTTINNNVDALGNGQPIEQLTYLTEQRFFMSRTQIGYPIGYFYGLITDGIFQDATEVSAGPTVPNAVPGDRRYKDISGPGGKPDGKIDAMDNTFIGSPIPKYLFGANAGASYKGFDFFIQIQGQQGNKILNGLKSQLYNIHNFNGTGVGNLAKEMIMSWNGKGTSNTLPRVAYNSTYTNYVASDFYVEDGSFLRCRTLQLGYTLSSSLVRRASLSSVRIYINTQNLFTLTKYKGFDPEISNSNALRSGVDNGQYPASRIYTLGINLQL